MGAFNATAGNGYAVDTSSEAYTATLPASPSSGDIIGFTDYDSTFATNNLTINPNGNKLIGTTDNRVISANDTTEIYTFLDGTGGWVLTKKNKV